jgi:hypothetical protein
MKLTPSSFEYSSGGIIGNVLPTGRWTQVIIVKNGSNFTYYEDGAVIGTASSNASTVAHTFFIANDPGFADGAPHYYLDDVRVYSRALSATEVGNLYVTGGAKINKTTTAVKNGLVGWWTFDGSSISSTIADSSGSGNNGYVGGGVSTTSMETIGKIGQALQFNGSSNYVTVPSNSNMSLSGGGTITGWVKLNDIQLGVGDGPRIATHGLGNAAWIGMSSGKFRALMFDGGNKTVTGSTVATPGLWYYVVETFDGSTLKLYVNGISQGSTAAGAINYTGSDQSVIIGSANAPSSPRYINASIDDVRIYNRALSSAEVTTIYNEGVGNRQNVDTTKETSLYNNGLVAYWSFNGSDVTDKIYDRVGGNNGYLGGGVSTTSMETIGKIGQALRFDGNDFINTTSQTLDDSSGFTISSWFKTTSAADQKILSNNTSSHPLQISGGKLRSCFNNVCAVGTTPINDGKWHFVVAVGSGGAVNVYLDGVTSPEVTVNQSGNVTGTVTIGDVSGGGAFRFVGTIDEVRIYNRALSASEVKQLYLAGK